MISTNMMSFMKKIVKSGEEDCSGGTSGSTGVTGTGTPCGTIGKLRQTVASGMKEIRHKAVTGGVGVGAPSSSSTPSSGTQPPPSQSASNAQRGDLRHLTDEEKSILQQVWKKEEEFEKESMQQKVSTFASVSPKAARKAQPAACRICRKRISDNEEYFTCSECHQGVCDDCASYRKDSMDGQEGWKCSFCRRRQDRLSIESVSSLGMRRMSSVHRMETADSLKQSFSDEGRTDSIESLQGQQRSPPATERVRRRSSSKISSPEMSNLPFCLQSSDKMHDTAISTKSLLSDRRSSSGSVRRLSVDYSHMLTIPTSSSSSVRASENVIKVPASLFSPHKTFRSEITNPPLSTKTNQVESSSLNEDKQLSKYSSTRSADHQLPRRTETKSNPSHKQDVTSSVKSTQKPSQSNQTSKENIRKKTTISLSERQIGSSSIDLLSNRKDHPGASHIGIVKHESIQEAGIKSNPRFSTERTRSGDVQYQEHSSHHHMLPSSSPKKEMDKAKHSSLEGLVRERRQSVDSQKNVHLMSMTSQQPPLPTPASSPSPYRIKMSSASESSIEDRSPEDDEERRQRNRMRRRTRFQRQKTFIDEHDSDMRDEWMMASYAANDDEVNSSFDSSSAFESFDNDPDVLAYRHNHPVQTSGRPIPHIASDVTLYQRRRSSDSSDFSDINAEIIGYRMHVARSGPPRRHIMGRNAVSDYDADLRYHSSTQHEASNLEERHASRSRMEKSLSADDPNVIRSRMAPRKLSAEPSDDRHRIFTPSYRHDMIRSNTANTYQYSLGDTRNYPNHQTWTRSARSLELTMDAPEFRRSSLNEGESIKIVIHDVDGSRNKGERSLGWNESMDWTYEEVYDAEARGLTVSTRHKASSASDVSREIDYHQSVGGRRRLPMTPDQLYHGEISLRLWYDPNRAELIVIIVAAKGLRRRKSSTGILPRACAKIWLMPSSGFRPIETPVAGETTNPEWNKTCVFPGIVMDDILEKVLEVSVYDVGQTSDTKVVIGMVNLPLRRADLQDSLVWYPLSNRSMSLLSHPHKASSTGMLVSTPAHDMARRLLTRSAQREMLQSQSLTDEGPAECFHTNEEQCLVKSTSMDSTLLHPEDTWDQVESHKESVLLPEHILLSQGNAKQQRAREIYSATAQESHPEMYCSDLEHSEWHKKTASNAATLRHVNSDTEAGKDASRQRTKNPSIRRRMSRGEENTSQRAARSVVIGGSSTDTDPSQSIDNPSVKRTTNRELPSILKKTGPQSSSSSSGTEKPASSKFGELKLGFSLQKGYLNVEVIKARGIRYTANGYAPDTYVKTYLKNGETKGLKRKTSVVRQSTEPRFHQTLKYAVGDINHKTLLAMIWERHKRFEHNQAIGTVELDLNKMKLTKPFTGWYQLNPLASADTESIGSS